MTQKLVFMGEHFEDEDSPLSGPSGVSFMTILAAAHIPPSKVTMCYPDAVLPATVRFVIASGNAALARWRPDLTVRYCHGRPMLIDGLIVVPVLHHVGLSRDPRWCSMVIAELEAFRSFCAHPDWAAVCSRTCVRCRAEAVRSDEHRVPYCGAHR